MSRSTQSHVIVTSYPKGRTPVRQKVTHWLSRRQRAFFRQSAKAGRLLLDLAGEHPDYPDALKIDPLPFASSELTAAAEATAYDVAHYWMSDLLAMMRRSPWPDDTAARLAQAIEAELFRVLKEFLVAVAVAERALAELSPQAVTFLDPAMADVVRRNADTQRTSGFGTNANRVFESTLECLRLLKEQRGWGLKDGAASTLHAARVLVFSDMASHARALAPVVARLKDKGLAVFCTDIAGQEIYDAHQIESLPIVRRRIASPGRDELATLLDIFRRLNAAEFRERREGYRVFRSSWARLQVVLLVSQALAWERFWRRIVAQIKPQLTLASVGIWPAQRSLLALSRQHGAKTAIVMHGNIPIYPPYYAVPVPDVYTVFGEVYRDNLIRCGQPTANIRVTGSTLPIPAPQKHAVNADAAARDTQPQPKTPLVVFLQSPPGSEFNWLDYRRTVEIFMATAAARPAWRFLVKLHPHPSNTGREFLDSAKTRGLRNVEVVKKPPVADCLRAADVAVAVYSTTVLDSLAMGVPVVVLRPAGREPLMPFGELGLAAEAETSDALLEKLEQAISGPRQFVSSDAMAGFSACRTEEAVAQTLAAIENLLIGDSL